MSPEQQRAALDTLNMRKAEAMAELEQAGPQGGAAALEELAGRISTVREGFMADLAGGVAWRVPSAVFDSAEVDRWGVWLTAAYTMPQLSFVAMVRYQDFTGLDEDGLDVGGRFIYTADRYALSAEYVGRHLQASTETGDLWRLAG